MFGECPTIFHYQSVFTILYPFIAHPFCGETKARSKTPKSDNNSHVDPASVVLISEEKPPIGLSKKALIMQSVLLIIHILS